MTEKTISLTTYYYKKGEIDNAVVKITDVKDNLTSTDTNKPLSANQGKELKALVDGKAASVHTHSKTQITDFSHTHGNLQNDGQVGTTVQASKNVVTDTNGKITTEEKYSHPASHPANMITGLANVATSGSYNDLGNKPFIPTKTSDLTNDSNFLTEHQDISEKANASDLSDVAFSGSYTDLDDKPTIPTLPTIADNLTTNDATQVLSAKQGKKLNDDKISKISNTYGVEIADEGNGTIEMLNNSLKYDVGYDKLYYLQVDNNHELATKGDIPSADVAFSGDYNDLINKPSTSSAEHEHDIVDIEGVEVVPVIITYTDDSTESRNLLFYTPEE